MILVVVASSMWIKKRVRIVYKIVDDQIVIEVMKFSQ